MIVLEETIWIKNIEGLKKLKENIWIKIEKNFLFILNLY
jgi:hypothetical protein